MLHNILMKIKSIIQIFLVTPLVSKLAKTNIFFDGSIMTFFLRKKLNYPVIVVRPE